MRAVLLVLAAAAAVAAVTALFALADRALRRAVQRGVADRIAATWRLPGHPAVTVSGFPFLAQLVTGRYDEVRVALNSVTRADVPFQDVGLCLRGVRAPLRGLVRGGRTAMTAADATATALVPFGAVATRLPPGLRLSAAGGRLRLSGSLGNLGFEMPISAGVSVRLTAGTIELSPRDVQFANAFSMPAGLLSMLAVALPVDDLPMGLEVTSVRVSPAGFEVSASARGVTFMAGDRE